MPTFSPPALPGASRVIDGLLLQLRQLFPQGPSSGASAAAANNIVRFLRSTGLAAPPPAQAAAAAKGLASIGQRALKFGAVGAVLNLGGDSAQNVQRSTQLLPLLTQSRATLEPTFQALDGLVTATTAWPDISGIRAALQSLLARSRVQIQALAVSKPEKAAQQLAALFKLFELRAGAGSAGTADQGRLAVARDIVTRSAPARQAKPGQPPANAARPASTPVSGPVSTIASARPQPAARGRDAVQALGEAIRAYKAETDASRRAALNDALALARSLKASDGGQWTAATLRSYASYDRQAARALYGAAPRTAPARLPVPSSLIERTKGAAVGAEADAINRKAAKEREKLLRNLAEQTYQKLKAGMNLGGWEESLSGLAEQHGVSLQELKTATRERFAKELGGMNGVQASAGGPTQGPLQVPSLLDDSEFVAHRRWNGALSLFRKIETVWPEKTKWRWNLPRDIKNSTIEIMLILGTEPLTVVHIATTAMVNHILRHTGQFSNYPRPGNFEMHARTFQLLEHFLGEAVSTTNSSGAASHTPMSLEQQWSSLARDERLNVIRRSQAELIRQAKHFAIAIVLDKDKADPAVILDNLKRILDSNTASNEWQVLQDILEEWFFREIPREELGSGQWSDGVRAGIVQRAVTLGLRPSADNVTLDRLAQHFLNLSPYEIERLLGRVRDELLNPPDVEPLWTRLPT